MLETVIEELMVDNLYYHSEFTEREKLIVECVMNAISSEDSPHAKQLEKDIEELEGRVSELEEEIEDHVCDGDEYEPTPLIDRKNARIKELEEQVNILTKVKAKKKKQPWAYIVLRCKSIGHTGLLASVPYTFTP